jgi:hypothetical protein
MALLQLAESPYNMLAENPMYLSQPGAVSDNYLFIPAGLFGMNQDAYVRADFFDSLSDTEFEAVIAAIAPYQPQGLSAVGAIVGTAVSLGKAVAPGIQKAIQKRAEKKDKQADGEKGIFKPGGNLANLATKVKAGINKFKDVPSDQVKAVTEKTTPVTGSIEVGGTSLDFSTGQPAAVPFFTKYKTPLTIAGVTVGGYLLYRLFK